jgi:Rieske Fe-S protein
MSTESKSLTLPMIGAHDNAGMDRRGFLTESIKLAVLAALAGTAASCSAGGATGPTLGGNFTIKVSDYPALASSGGVVALNHGGFPIAIANLGGGNWGAYSLICPHQGGLVQWTGSQFQCTVHGSRYNIQGDWQGGQPTGNLHHYQATYDASTNSLTING